MKSSIKCMAFLLFGMLSWAQHVEVNETNVTFLYESRAEIRPPDHTLAEIISTDYRSARDEFTRHDLLQEIKPVIEKRMAEGQQTKQVVLRIGGTLGDYDFDKNAFPTGFSDATYIPFGYLYAVNFTNASQIDFLPVEMSSARTLAGELRKSRRAVFSIYGDIDSVSEEELKSFVTSKVVKVKITKMQVALQSGTEVGSIDF